MPLAREIMERAARLLLDEAYTRWTLPELCDWLNEGQRAIVLAKPSAYTESRGLALAVGTLQRVPVSPSPTPLLLIDVKRNLRSAVDATPREGGRVVTITSEGALNAANPNWHDRRTVPFRKEVRNYIFDEKNPLEFYTYPGNDGTGVVEVVLGCAPAVVAASGAADAIGSYGATLSLPEPYSVPLLDYVLYRAFSKDDLAGNAGRAAFHYQRFAEALGIKVRVEGGSSPNAKRAAP